MSLVSADALGDFEEFAGRVPLAVVVFPAHQRFDAVDDAGAEVEFRLERAADAPIADGGPQVHFDPAALDLGARHFGVERTHPRAGFAPGFGERGARLAPQSLRRRIIRRPDAEARFRRREHFRSGDQIGVGKTRHERADALLIEFACRRSGENQAEFVAAATSQPLVGAQRIADPLGDPLQQFVARRFAMDGVDLA